MVYTDHEDYDDLLAQSDRRMSPFGGQIQVVVSVSLCVCLCGACVSMWVWVWLHCPLSLHGKNVLQKNLGDEHKLVLAQLCVMM